MQKKKKKKMLMDGDKIDESTLAHPKCSYSLPKIKIKEKN